MCLGKLLASLSYLESSEGTNVFFPEYLVDYPNITSDAKVYTSLWTKTYNWSLYIIIIIILLHEGNCLSEQEECFAMLFILASKTMFLFTSLLHS